MGNELANKLVSCTDIKEDPTREYAEYAHSENTDPLNSAYSISTSIPSEKLDPTQIELREANQAIISLRKQNEYLKRQNEEFILRYGSDFSSPPASTTSSQISFSTDFDQKPFSPLKSLTFDQTNIILSFSNTNSFVVSDTLSEHNECDECRDIGSCPSIKRIIMALKWYSMYVSDHGELLRKLLESNYDKYLVDDYQHILHSHHLIEENEINLDGEYKLIQTEINKQIKPCHIETCNGFKRYKGLSPKFNDDTFVLDAMNMIHCFLIHSEYN